MLGGVIMALILVVVIPVAVLMTGPLVAAVLGFLLKDNAERQGADTPWVELNT
jgi:hypothetical protein